MGHIPHVLIDDSGTGATVPLGPEMIHHLTRVLRRRSGDPVSYTDGRGLIGEGVLESESIVRGPELTVAPPAVAVTVAVAPPAERDRARFLVEKLAELGVSRLVWVTTRFSQAGAPPSDKVEAWARAALEQSRGAYLMEVGPGRIEDLERPLVVCEPSGGSFPEALDRVTVLIGPEGGLVEAEIPRDATRVTLGPRILRVETAAVVSAGCLLCR
jgi:16S rRNA (uracil1498-N3)-methyltransferase